MISEERKQQFRDAQRRRREKLAEGKRSQVNIFLSPESKQLMDRWCLEYNTDRHDLMNGLIQAYAKAPSQIPFALQD